ncbi:hypothetical protein HOY82DRAFT_634113 [Tuber indicum]|nr:hypothetical protein HOY82DRAFT_634113 [Tuber indicum]
MLTHNFSPELELINGACGNVYDLGWQKGARTDLDRAHQRAPFDLPHVVMVALEIYTGTGYEYEDDNRNPVELVYSEGRRAVPNLRLHHEFVLPGRSCTRSQFLLVIAYAIKGYNVSGYSYWGYLYES